MCRSGRWVRFLAQMNRKAVWYRRGEETSTSEGEISSIEDSGCSGMGGSNGVNRLESMLRQILVIWWNRLMVKKF